MKKITTYTQLKDNEKFPAGTKWEWIPQKEYMFYHDGSNPHEHTWKSFELLLGEPVEDCCKKGYVDFEKSEVKHHFDKQINEMISTLENLIDKYQADLAEKKMIKENFYKIFN